MENVICIQSRMTVFVLINDETVFHVWEFGATMLMTCKIRNVVGDV